MPGRPLPAPGSMINITTRALDRYLQRGYLDRRNKAILLRFKRHFFVCTTERPPYGKPSCGAQGSAAILAALLAELDLRPELTGDVAITGCGCLGPCYDGPTIAVYPEGVFYGGVSLEDIPEIAERHMAGGQAVSRLVLPDRTGEEAK